MLAWAYKKRIGFITKLMVDMPSDDVRMHVSSKDDVQCLATTDDELRASTPASKDYLLLKCNSSIWAMISTCSINSKSWASRTIVSFSPLFHSFNYSLKVEVLMIFSYAKRKWPNENFARKIAKERKAKRVACGINWKSPTRIATKNFISRKLSRPSSTAEIYAGKCLSSWIKRT